MSGLLSVAGCLEIDKYRCLLGNVAGFWTGRERVLGTGGGAGGKEKKRKEKTEEENKLYCSLS